jgi:hypothetical protein
LVSTVPGGKTERPAGGAHGTDLAPGARLGPYEVIGQLGLGGMGAVYRARDARLGRDVAIKVLPERFRTNPALLRRFEVEASATGALNHPNILVVHDVGIADGTPYIVSELLDGQSLRERLHAGSVSRPEAIDISIQICRGLAAAHEKGIVHRDLKPENVLLLRDRRVKILDFGLARMEGAAVGHESTLPGSILGTVGYMAPEQVRGNAASPRSDIFSLGTIIYELLSGKRAFEGASSVETMHMIVKVEPPPLDNVPTDLERAIRRCIAKRPEDRFQTVDELAADLERCRDAPPAPTVEWRRPRTSPRSYGGVLVAVASVAVGVTVGRFVLPAGPRAARAVAAPAGRRAEPAPVTSERLTRRRGHVYTARFAPDGQTIVYSAAWEDAPVQVYVSVAGSPDARPVSAPGSSLFAVSPRNEVALALGVHTKIQGGALWEETGTLALAPLGSGEPRPVQDGVRWADLDPSGELTVVRNVGGRYRIESPIDHPIYETGALISHLRVSPKGDVLAFAEHPWTGDDRGHVVVLDADRKRRVLGPEWSSLAGLAWSPDQREILFTAQERDHGRVLRAVTLDGAMRTLLEIPGDLVVQDVAPSGRVLVTREDARSSAMVLVPGGDQERDASWFDWSVPTDLSRDGTTVVFHEDNVGGNYSGYLRRTDGTSAMRLGEGVTGTVSPDGRWVLAKTFEPQGLWLLPTGTGAPRQVPLGRLEGIRRPNWLPDGQRVVFGAREAGHGDRVWVAAVDGTGLRAISDEGVSLSASGNQVAPDGRFVLGKPVGAASMRYGVEDGKGRPIPGLRPDEEAIGWNVDGGAVFACTTNVEVPLRIDLVDLKTGQRQPWRTIQPTDRTGAIAIDNVLPTPDGRGYAYRMIRSISNLYVIANLPIGP